MMEKLLFCLHQGMISGHVGGVIMQGACLLIACNGYYSDGFMALWDEYADVDEFFGEEGLDLAPGITNSADGHGCNGLWVYEVLYTDADVYDGSYAHLRGGEIRRPTLEELEPLTHGKAPWGGITF